MFRLLSKFERKLKYTKERKFIDFSKTYLHERNVKITKYDICQELSDQYDFFVAGSDQVWNPTSRGGDPVYFLVFAEPHKRIAYAPSFGYSSIPQEYTHDYKERLEKFRCLSVREDAGAEIIYQLTGESVDVVADPTMLLTKNEWLTLAGQQPEIKAKKYLLTYFCGRMGKEVKDKIMNIAAARNIDIINLHDPSDVEEYAGGPLEFINCIQNAECFFTDSFHGVAFSILMQTPFVVCQRNISIERSMYSRLETVLKKFHFLDRVWPVNEACLFDIDWSDSIKTLDSERELAMQYLKSSLK